MRDRSAEQLVAAALDGERAALAQLLSVVEQGGAAARDVGRLTYPHGGRAHTVGITGAPGSGKSTLTDRLIGALREGDEAVAVLAVDPSSPFSGGAILGDRVRMQQHATDAGVFIRSMATRGRLGGLSLATPEAVRVLDASGYPWVLVETVGVGQVEVEIAATADTTIVVVNPGWGDAVQANKAGLLEIADLFVINKCDRPGADETERDLQQMLDLGDAREWRPPVARTVATTGEGVADLRARIDEHRAHLARSGELERRRARRVQDELRAIVARRLEARAVELLGGEVYARLRDDVVARRLDPYTAADQVLDAAGL